MPRGFVVVLKVAASPTTEPDRPSVVVDARKFGEPG